MLETPHAGTPIAPPDRKRQIAADTSKAATEAGKERGGIHRNSPPISPCAFRYKEHALRAAGRRLKPKEPWIKSPPSVSGKLHKPRRRAKISFSGAILSDYGRLANPRRVLDRRHCCGSALASSSACRSSAGKSSRVAAARLSSCCTEVALAIGAVTLGRAISQAIATVVGVVSLRFATATRVSMILMPRSFR